MTFHIILREDGKEAKSFDTEDESYAETGAICIADKVYGYDRIPSGGRTIVFSSYSDAKVKTVNSLDDLR